MSSPIASQGERPVVVELGTVDRPLVTGVLGDGIAFIPTPTDEDLAVAVGAIEWADFVVDAAFLGRTTRTRMLAGTGVSSDLIDPAERPVADVRTSADNLRAVLRSMA